MAQEKQTSKRLLLVLFSLLLVGVLSACAALKGDAAFKEIEATRIGSSDEMVKNIGRADRGAQREGTVKVDPGAWLVSKPIRIAPVDRLPRIFREEIFFNRSVVSLSEFASRVTAITKVRSSVLQDAARLATTAINLGSAPLPGAEAQKAAATTLASTDSGSRTTRTLHIVYRGSLKGLLDTVSTRLGINWAYDGDTIRFFLTTSRSYIVRAVTSDAALSANVSSSAGGGGSGTSSASSQSITTNAKLSLWKDVEDGVKAMLSTGGSVTTSLSMGVLTVNDTPEVLDRVGVFIDRLNQEISRQIALEVNIYTVSLDKSDNFGLDWDAILRSGNLRLSMTPIGLPSDGSSFKLDLLSSAGAVDSSVMFQALSSAGKARRVTTASVVATNNQPVPVQVGTQTSYIGGSNTTMSTNGNTLTTMTVNSLTTGFNLTLLPRILDNNKILLQFTIDLSLLKQIRSFATSTSRVEMPEVDTRNFLQRVALRSGETLIVSGFEQTIDNASKAGVFNADNVLFGNREIVGSREVLVITIKPTEIISKS